MIAMFLLGSAFVLLTALSYALFIPGLERKVHARIQNRYGPPIFTPGLWNIAKFFFKQRILPNSPNPGYYHLFILVGLAAVSSIILYINPLWWGVLGFGSVFAVMGMLKVEEVMYVFMGSFSKSVMSLTMPYPDNIKGAKPEGVRRFFEEISATRALKMITFGSFPIYAALFVPFAVAGSVSIQDVVLMQNPDLSLSSLRPFVFTFPGMVCAAVYLIGYGIITNTRPFDILKPKIDVIEGPVLEYASVWRGLYYLFSGLMSFALSSLFITVFIGVPMSVVSPGLFLLHLALIPGIPVIWAIARAFSPVFTFKQIYPISMGATIAAFVALALNYVRF